MKYRKQEAVVRETSPRKVTVAVRETPDCAEESSCAACGKCSFPPPASRTFTVPRENSDDCDPGDRVTFYYPQPSFSLSVLTVFILPLVLLIVFPIVVISLGRAIGMHGPASGWAPVAAAFLGISVAVGFNILLNRRILTNHPPKIRKRNSHE